MRGADDLSDLARRTGEIYDRNAARFHTERRRDLSEQAWLDRFLSLVSPGGAILDVGCGTGEPVAAYMIGRGFAVTGVDVSDAMIAIASQRFPTATWITQDMRTLKLDGRFHGIVSWHAFFHLTPTEQRSALPHLADHLIDGGAFLVTVGPDAGETVGYVAGEAVYHASLAPDEYRRILDTAGLTVIDLVLQDPTCNGATVLLAKKQRTT